MFGMDFSKFVVLSVLIITIIAILFGFLLAFYCVFQGFTGTVPWIAATMTAICASLGTVCSFYQNMVKSDHSEGGITYETAKACGFGSGSAASPSI